MNNVLIKFNKYFATILNYIGHSPSNGECVRSVDFAHYINGSKSQQNMKQKNTQIGASWVPCLPNFRRGADLSF